MHAIDRSLKQSHHLFPTSQGNKCDVTLLCSYCIAAPLSTPSPFQPSLTVATTPAPLAPFHLHIPFATPLRPSQHHTPLFITRLLPLSRFHHSPLQPFSQPYVCNSRNRRTTPLTITPTLSQHHSPLQPLSRPSFQTLPRPVPHHSHTLVAPVFHYSTFLSYIQFSHHTI